MPSRKRSRHAEDDDDGTAKKPRTYSQQDARLAKIYSRLADEVSETRIQAAKELLQELGPQPSVTLEVLQKAFLRLIRGLCSGRKGARYGFFVALAELLRQAYGTESTYDSSQLPDLKELIDGVEAATTPDGEAVGQEKKDHLLGRLFTWKAFITSGALDSPSQNDLWDQVIENVLVLHLQVTWLRDECAQTLCEVFTTTSVAADQKSRQVNAVLKDVVEKGLAKTPEGVAIWLTAKFAAPDVELPKKVWHKGNPLHQKERQALIGAFKQRTTDKSGEDAEASGPRQAGHWQINPGFAWVILVQSMVRQAVSKMDDDSEEALDVFTKAWRDMIDNTLFSAKSSPERKTWGFRLFSDTISSGHMDLLPSLFSVNLVNCLGNQLRDSDRLLNGAAQNVLKKIKARAEREPESCFNLFDGLMEHDLTLLTSDKDRRVTRLASDIIAACPNHMQQSIANKLRMIIRIPGSDAATANEPLIRQIAADLLVDVFRHRNQTQDAETQVQPTDDWMHQAVAELALFAYHKPTTILSPEEIAKPVELNPELMPKPEFSQSSRQVMQSRLYSILTILCSSNLQIGVEYAEAAVPLLSRNVRKQKKDGAKPADAAALSRALILTADDGVWTQVAKAHATIASLRKTVKGNSANQQVYLALRLLFAFSILEVLNGDADAASLLEELQLCFQSIGSLGKADEQAFDMIMELLLSFMSKSSVLYKKMAEQVFTACASGLSYDSLQSMLHILEQQEDLAGQQELFNAHDSVDEEDGGSEDDEESEDSDNDEEDASDVEMIDDDGLDDKAITTRLEASSEGENEDDSEDEDDDAEEAAEESDSDDEEIQKFNKMLADTLRTSNPLTNGKKQDDDSSDDEADMDDDAMEALDPHLTKIFQQRQAKAGSTKRKEQKGAKENMTNFKGRVLDLLAILVKTQSSNSLTMHILPSLLNLMRTTKAKHLATKANDVLTSYLQACSRSKEYPKPPSTDEKSDAGSDDESDNSDPLSPWAILQLIHDEAKLTSSPIHSSACSRASLFVVKALVLQDSSNLDQSADIYNQTLKDTTKSKKGTGLRPQFFTEFVAWSFDRRK